MSKPAVRLLCCLAVLTSALPASGQIAIYAPSGVSITNDFVLISADDPCGNPDGADVAGDWQIDPGVDGSALVDDFSPYVGITWLVSWTSGGAKQVGISFSNGTCPNTGTATINVNTCAFALDTYPVGEGDGTVQLAVERLFGSDDYLDCDLRVVGGTATLDEDYSDPSTTFTWGPGDIDPLTFPLTLLDNGLVEPTETIDLELLPFIFQETQVQSPKVGAASGIRVPAPGTLFSPDNATVEIADNDPASVSFQSATASVSEAEGILELTLVRTGADGAFTVNLMKGGGTADTFEWDVFPFFVNFGETETSKTVTFYAYGDQEIESNETAVVKLVSPTNGVTLRSTPTETVTILDSGICRLTPQNYSVSEAVNVFVKISRLGGTAGPLECQLYTFSGDGPGAATPFVDYVPSDAVVSWTNGVGGEKPVQVRILQDGEEEDVETFNLELYPYFGQPFSQSPGDPSNQQRVGQAGIYALDTGSVEIVDDDGLLPTTLSFVLPSSRVTEGEAAHAIEVTRTGTDGAVTVEVVVDGGTADPTDYSLATPIVLSWPDGEAGVRSFEVTALTDDEEETDETVVFRLTNPQRPGPDPTLVAPQTHELTIGNLADRGAVRFTSTNFEGGEGGGSVEIGVSREISSTGAVSVDVCFLEGTTEPEDLVLPASATLEWADGESGVRTLSLDVVDDTLIEGTEFLPLELCEPSDRLALITPSTATLLVGDNDFATTEEIVIEGAATGPEDPIVVYDREGRKIVVWVAADGNGLGVFAQIFDTEGVPIGPAFRVNSSSAGDSTQPSAIIRDDGTIVIVWRQSGGVGLDYREGRLASAGSSSSVVARGFSPTGSSTTSETVVASSETGDLQNPEVGADRDGKLTITWEIGGSVKGQSFDANFQPRTPVVDVSTLPGASDPEIAVSASGDFVVAWKQEPGSADGTILAQAFNDDGSPKGEVQVLTQNPQASSPAVAVDDQGNFFVVFTEPADGLDVFGRLFDRRGRRRGPKIRINVVTAGDQIDPRVDMNSIGDIAVVWQSVPLATPGAVGTGGGSSIVSRFFSPQAEPESSDVVVSQSEAGSTVQKPDVSIENEDETTAVFEKRGPDDQSEGIFSKIIRPTLTSGPCAEDDTTLCVQGEQRFRVLVEWQDFEGNTGEGQAVALTNDTGYFWFFSSDNVELLIKVLDGCAINNRLWVFAGGLTNVEVNLRVDDVVAGVTATYFSSLGRSFQPILDTKAFKTCGADAPPPRAATSVGEELSDLVATLGGIGTQGLRAGARGTEPPCDGSEPTLCLRNQRFEVNLLWETADSAGQGQPVALNDESGTFWFYDPDNVEAVVKVLDGCAINGHYWVFAAGITDVATDLQVLDTETSSSRSYTTTLGTPFAPVLDVRAFECQ